ncbi:MAG: NAD-dependent epimerase/dehydratase family protein [Humibacillus sp.]|nr:NAD-dependent epimerase/dehydratase family protein [Humibacillus sp.]MDN5778412.1 NAD-dependent epimerase/dehydratase family protein [Humibacillus sp.]
MSHHLVLGAGGIGRTTTSHLVGLGHTVTLVSRSGRVTDRPWEADSPGAETSVTVVAADARDADRLTELAAGAATIVNAINPPSYATWAADWPPMSAAILAAAERSGAGLVIIGNLYGYGQVEAPMTEQTPLGATGEKGRLRNRMWTDALALHEQGRIRVTELRSSDYFGPGATKMTSVLADVVIDRVAHGRVAIMPVGRTDVPHSWTYIPDVGTLAALVAERGEGDESVWGRAWHVPTVPARTIAQAADDVARLTGRRGSRVMAVPRPLGTALGVVVPFLRQMRETRHQFERPFVLDSSQAEAAFGLTATPWEQALEATIADRTPDREAVTRRPVQARTTGS